MSQYPVNTEQGLYDAVNYLASGPSGLGQNFAGFSSYTPSYVRGTFRQPFTVATTATTSPPKWYIAPITVTGATILGNATGTNTSTNYQISFTPQATIPFAAGDSANPEGIVDTLYGSGSNFNGTATILSGTTSTVIFQTNSSYDFGTYVSGGTITKNNINNFVSTDCNARVVVTGPTDRVFISSQLSLNFTYSCTTSSAFDLVVAINRYVPTSNAPLAQGTDYAFVFDQTISQTVTHYSTSTAGTFSVNGGQNIFTTVLDQPSYGYYWYICEISFNTIVPGTTSTHYTGNAEPGTFTVGLRSLTAQVVKQ